MTASTVWHGTADEGLALDVAIKNHCTCVCDGMGRRVSTCPPHEMLVHNQRALDGLLWMHRMAAQLKDAEWAE